MYLQLLKLMCLNDYIINKSRQRHVQILFRKRIIMYMYSGALTPRDNRVPIM